MYLYNCMSTHLNYLSLFVTWETLIAYLGWMQTSMVNQNSCLGVVVMLYAIF